MRSGALFFAVLVLCLSSTFSFAQAGFFANWFNMVSATQAEQPRWITPLATTAPRLEQEFRYDIQWQIHNNGVTTDNYGVSKGLEIIPAKKFEVILAVPPYVVNNPYSKDGFGDWQFLVKYRIAAGNAEHANYILHDLSQATLGPMHQPIETDSRERWSIVKRCDASGEERRMVITPLLTLTRRHIRIAGLLPLSWAAIAIAGYGQGISVQNDSGSAVKITAAEITVMDHQKLSVDEHGKTVTYEGVPLRSVLEKAGITFGETLRGKRLSSCLLVEAADGYQVVIALPELDPGFTDRVILLADKADGHPLDRKEGPFRIVVPGEKRMARWVRQVTALKVVQVQ